MKYRDTIYDITWMESAECRSEEPEKFYFDSEGFLRKLAEQYCKKCPVINECLEYALNTEEMYGLWGGTTPRQRREMLKQKQLGSTALGAYR